MTRTNGTRGFLAALALAVPLSVFAAGPAWKEEVVMFDGAKVVVERQQILGNPLDRELSEVSFSRPPVKANRLRVPLSGGGWSAWWEGPGLNPLALGREGSEYYLAAMPKLCNDYDRWGRPVPPYVFFRFDGTAWQRIAVDEFPAPIVKLNLSIAGNDDHRAAVASGYISAERVASLNTRLPDYINNVYRSGLAGFERCKRRLDASDPVQPPAAGTPRR